MAAGAERARDLLGRAHAARAAGDTATARAAFVSAYEAAREAGDVGTMTESALGLAGGNTFGTHPGRVPAFLHEAYLLADGVQRVRLAVALARAWAYGGDPGRAVPFATEAVAGADAVGDPLLLADALDAQLLVRWGPDDFDERVRITTRLEDVVAHVTDVEVRLSAYLWRLTTALEALDPVSVRRQLRALQQLADESGAPRVRFFSTARQAMYALLVGDADRADDLRREAVAAGAEAGEADTYAIDHSLAGQIAQLRGAREHMETEAALYEQFGTTEGVVSVFAQAAELWADAGQPARARPIIEQIASGGLTAVARDVDWMLTVTTVTAVAARLGMTDVVCEGVELLTPYAGRGVVNAGGVSLPYVVDDVLRAGCAALGRPREAASWAERATASYRRIGAVALLRRLGSEPAAGPPGGLVAHLRPGEAGIWTVGTSGSVAQVREVKGFRYLRTLLQRPGVEVSALALSDAVAGHPGDGVDDAAADEVIDRQALAAYRRRLSELDADLAEATSWSDEGRIARARGEREALLDEIGRATGLGGRSRRTSSSSERARVAVRKAIAAAIDRVDGVDPTMARVLRDCIDTGGACRYDPDPSRPITWVLD